MFGCRLCWTSDLLCRTTQSTSYSRAGSFSRMDRVYCTAVEESKVALHIPRTVMPSPRLITKLDNKDIFLRLLLELEFLYNAGKRLPTYMTDSDWMRYIRMASIIERCCFLRQLYESRREMEEKDENKILWTGEEAGNSSCSFNTLHCFGREDFRRFAYEVFGSRLLAAWRCNNSFPPMLVDCRYLSDLSLASQKTLTKQIKDLVLDNSLQRNPFPVLFVNYRATSDIAVSVVNSWLRKRCLPKYRPPNVNASDGKMKEEVCNDGDGSRPNQLSSVPFIPVVTSTSIRECLGDTEPEQIAYINPKAEQYLPGPLTKYKAFVVCATPDTTFFKSSFKAARAEKLDSYRLPISQFLNIGKTPVTMPLRITANIVRDAYNGDQWKTAFEKHIPYFSVLAGDVYRNHDSDKNDLQILEEWLSDAVRKGKRKRIHFHRYSREARREAQVAAGVPS